MLTIQECKKYLRTPLSDEEIEKMRDELYQVADILVDNFLKKKENKKV